MAVKGTTDPDPVATSPSFAPSGPTVDPAQASRAPGYTGGVTQNTDLFAFLNQLGAGQALGPDIEKYIADVTAGMKGLNPPVQVRRLAEPHGAHAFISGGYSFILMFDSLLARDPQNFTPQSDWGLSAVNALIREITPTPGPLGAILVQPEDYVRAPLMARYLSLYLQTANSPIIQDATVQLLMNNDFTVDVNPETARNFVEAKNPHTVQPRADLGLTLYAKSQRRPGPFSREFDDSRPIAALTGYTEIWHTGDQGFAPGRYVATVHITNITSELPLPGIIPLCLALAADRFVDRRGWRHPFMSFQKGKPNLGNLSLDPKDPNKLWFQNTVTEMDNWIGQNMFQKPYLALDVSEGQARIPAIAAYGDAGKYPGKVYEQISSFFGNIPLDRNVIPFNAMACSYLGQYSGSQRGQLLDSREMDYLSLVATGGAQDPNVQQLLQYHNDGASRARLISQLTGNSFRSLYRTQVSIIIPELLTVLARTITDKIKIIGGVQEDRLIPTQWMDDLQKRYAAATFNTQSTSTQPGFGGMRFSV